MAYFHNYNSKKYNLAIECCHFGLGFVKKYPTFSLNLGVVKDTLTYFWRIVTVL